MNKVLACFTVVVAMLHVGCSKIAIADGSLDYTKSAKTLPLNIPNDIQMRQPQPLYPAPSITERALQQAPTFVNAKGNRFELSRPNTLSATAQTGIVAEKPSVPKFVVDGSQNPLLLITGTADEIWRYTTSALSTANLPAKADTQIAYRYHVSVDDKTYQLSMGNSSTGFVLAVFDGQRYADTQVAQHILERVASNWPQ